MIRITNPFRGDRRAGWLKWNVCKLARQLQSNFEKYTFTRVGRVLLIKRRRVVTRNSHKFAQVEAEREAVTLFEACTRDRTGSLCLVTSYTSWISLVIEGRMVGSLSATEMVNWTGAKLIEFTSILTREIIPLPPRAKKTPFRSIAHSLVRELRYRCAVINRLVQV